MVSDQDHYIQTPRGNTEAAPSLRGWDLNPQPTDWESAVGVVT